MILGDAHARDMRSTGIVGMNAWSNAIAGDVNADVVADVIADVIADDIAERGRFLSSCMSPCTTELLKFLRPKSLRKTSSAKSEKA